METPIWLVRWYESGPDKCLYFLHRERAVQCFVELGRKYARRADWMPDAPGSTATSARFGDVEMQLSEGRLNTEDGAAMPATSPPPLTSLPTTPPQPPPTGTVELYMQIFPNWEGELPHMPSGTVLPLRSAPASCYAAETAPGASGQWVRVHVALTNCRGRGGRSDSGVWFTQGVVA
jgi:hypothetical protein